MQHKEYLSTMEAAKITGLDRTQVFRLIKKGTIPALKIGRNYAILKKDLFIFTEEVSKGEEKNIGETVHKVFKDYKDVMKKLGKE